MAVTALILGGDGMLGKALARLLPGLGYDVVAALGRARCDITDAAQIERALTEAPAEVVFNAAAYTNVDGAEDDVDGTFRANARGPELLAQALRRRGGTLVHVSTDFVFDGEQERPYDEFDLARPQGVYARSKLAGEQLAARALDRLFVLRIGCLYGTGGKNFPSTMATRLLAGQVIQADATRNGSPTWVDDVARKAARLALSTDYGLYHCTSAGETSWYEYARFIAEALGRPGEQVKAADPHALKLKAPRPRRAVLDNLMLRQRGYGEMPHWKDAAHAFLAGLPRGG